MRDAYKEHAESVLGFYEHKMWKILENGDVYLKDGRHWTEEFDDLNADRLKVAQDDWVENLRKSVEECE